MVHKQARGLPASIASIMCFVLGGLFALFSGTESIGGFTRRPIDPAFAIGGLMEIATFALPLFIAGWLLWVHPKIGAWVLVCFGLTMGIWMTFGWAVPRNVTDWVIRILLIALPIVLGALTLLIRPSSLRTPSSN